MKMKIIPRTLEKPCFSKSVQKKKHKTLNLSVF